MNTTPFGGGNQKALFEFPLNERFRTYLRLEALYARWQHLLKQESEHDHHSALLTLFEIFEFAFRYDVKGDLLLEINRYKHALSLLRHLPQLSEQKLTQTLLRLVDAQKQVELSPKFGSTLVENDWLLNVKTRMVVPGGICSFDGSFYFQWLKKSADERRADLESWILVLMPMFDTLQLILMIVRDARKHKVCITMDKTYQQSLNGARFDILQIETDRLVPFAPEISANKHVVWIRFSLPSFRCQPQHMRLEYDQAEIQFDLNLCGMQ